MSNVFAKLRDFVGLNDPADYEYEYDEIDGEEYQNLYQQQEEAVPPVAAPQPEEPRARRRVRDRMISNETGLTAMGSNVIGMPGSIGGASEVVVMEPRSFEEMPQAIQALPEVSGFEPNHDGPRSSPAGCGFRGGGYLCH